jgi:hypothetical protein
MVKKPHPRPDQGPPQISDDHLALAASLRAHNDWLRTKEGKLWIAREWLEHYRQGYDKSLRENRQKEEKRRADLLRKLTRATSEKRGAALKRYLRWRTDVGNPIYPWLAFVECQSSGLEIPDWVLGYFKEVAIRIWRLSLGSEQPKTGKGRPEENPDGGPPDGDNRRKWLLRGALQEISGRSRIQTENLDSIISEIFGFKGPGKTGRGSVVSRFLDHSDTVLAERVWSYVEAGHKLKHSYEHVAEDANKSEATVRRAWSKHRTKFPPSVKK